MALICVRVPLSALRYLSVEAAEASFVLLLSAPSTVRFSALLWMLSHGTG